MLPEPTDPMALTASHDELAQPPADAAEPFAPPSDAWRRVSPALATVKRVSATIWLALIFVPATVASWLLLPQWPWLPIAVAALGLVWWVWLFLRAGRVVSRYGWARRDEDLCFTEGLMFRSLTVVPFGRMQVVRVSSGPLLRWKNLANVEFVTASAASNVTIPGLPADEARELRDLIIELTDAQGSGL